MTALAVYPINYGGQPVGVAWLVSTTTTVRCLLRVGDRVAEASSPRWLTPGLGETRAAQQAAEALSVADDWRGAGHVVRLRAALRPPVTGEDARPSVRWRRGWTGYLRAAGFDVWRES